MQDSILKCLVPRLRFSMKNMKCLFEILIQRAVTDCADRKCHLATSFTESVIITNKFT